MQGEGKGKNLRCYTRCQQNQYLGKHPIHYVVSYGPRLCNFVLFFSTLPTAQDRYMLGLVCLEKRAPMLLLKFTSTFETKWQAMGRDRHAKRRQSHVMTPEHCIVEWDLIPILHFNFLRVGKSFESNLFHSFRASDWRSLGMTFLNTNKLQWKLFPDHGVYVVERKVT